jgi:hypothetical protein
LSGANSETWVKIRLSVGSYAYCGRCRYMRKRFPNSSRRVEVR